MLLPYENKKIFIASDPVDFRMSIDSLAKFVENAQNSHLYDGSIYVFYNKHQNKIKCLFWDRNGFVLYYKRLDKCKFRIKKMLQKMENISASDLEILLSGFDTNKTERQPLLLENE